MEQSGLPIAEVAGERDAGSGQRCRANSPRGSTDTGTASYLPVKAVSRAFAVLRTLSHLQHASIAELHRETGIPKPTIVRTLETLISEGYVVRDNFSRGYRTTSQVQALSRGFSGIPLVIEAARVAAIALTEQIKWPVSIGTIQGGSVVVNFSTAPISPYGYPFPTLNRPFPVLDTAIGRCYISFCQEAERDRILDAPASRGGRQSRFTRARLEQTIAEVRSRGYALQDPFVADRMYEEAHRFQFVALPLLSGGTCHGCLGIGFYKRAVQRDEVEATIIEPARIASLRIAHNIEMLGKDAAARTS
jgi:IclR family mhp operon transcriptional activator